MFLKKGFLLIELLVAIAFFVVFSTAFYSLQFETLKNKDLAQKRLKALNLATNQMEMLKVGREVEKNDAINVAPIKINFKDKKLGDFEFVKITVKQKTLLKKSCTVCLLGSL